MTEEQYVKQSVKPRKPYTLRPRGLNTRFKQMRVNTWEIKMLTLLRAAKAESEKNFEYDIVKAIKEAV